MSDRPDIDVVVLEVRSNQLELAADRGWQAGALGVEELAGAVRVTFSDRDAATAARHRLSALGEVVDVTTEAGVDWVDRWRPHARPAVEPPFAVRPPWLAPPADDSLINLVVDPGPTFGHGGHPTTRLLLRALPAEVRPGHRMLDVGCGSGVLAIAAARLGAGEVRAIDVDPTAVEVTSANAARNQVVVEADITPLDRIDDRFDVVTVNLTAGVLTDLASDLRRVTAGRLLVSGVRIDQDVAGLESVTWTDEQDGWRAGVLPCGP